MFGKNLSVVIFLFAIIFLSASCDSPDTGRDITKKDEAQKSTSVNEKIESINRLLEEATLKGNYEALLDYYTEDIIVAPGISPVVKGKTAIVESYKENRKWEVKYHSFNARAEEIWEYNDNVFERGSFGMSYSYKDHPKPKAYSGSYFTVWQKEKDDSLKIKYVMWNLNFDPCD